MIYNVTKKDIDFNSLYKGLNLLVFYTKTCNTCKMMEPVFEELSKENLEIYKVDMNEDMEFTTELDALTRPTVIVYKNGKEKLRFTRYNPASLILEKISELE